MKLYESDDYRRALKECLLEKKKTLGNSFSFQNMAKACRIQKTYLSKVLGEKAHLSADQLYLAAEYLGFNERDRSFILLLFEESRSEIPKRKKNLLSQINTLRAQNLRSESYLKAQVVSTHQENLTPYYLNPLMQIVHMFLTVERYRNNIKEIAEKLNFSTDFLNHILRNLQQLGIIEIHQGRYQVVVNNLHLSKDSQLYAAYRVLLRSAAQDKISRLYSDKTYNFSVIFSTDPKTRDIIQSEFLDFLTRTQKLVAATEPQEVFQMNFDLFSWSDM